MDKTEKIILFVFIGLVGFVACLAIACVGLLSVTGLGKEIKTEVNTWEITPEAETATEVVPTPTEDETLHTFTDTPEDTAEALHQTVVPESDWIQLAEQFEGKKDIPLTLTTEPQNFKVGDTQVFWILNGDTNDNSKITATLQYISGDVYFWIQNGVDFKQSEMKKACDTFAQKIYPTDQEFFGKEWIPGVDNDPHLYVLFAGGLGQNIAGYESDSDTYLSVVQPYSNQHEMFYVNTDIQTFSDDYTLSVMAHELQHLIHSYHDSNEESWINEGFSELAVFLNGYDTGGFDYLFSEDPDINLTEWPNDSDATDAHYGSSFLFTDYLLDRFGEETTKAVVADKMNGLNSIDDVFATENIVDPITNKVMTSDDLFQDWTIANILNNKKISDGRYAYHNYQDLPDFTSAEQFLDCSSHSLRGDVSQYGADYISVNCDSDYQLHFSGAPTAKILSIYPKDGTHYVWSNMVDNSATQMTHEFDLTGEKGIVTLSYDIWYDIETDYDYLYLLASTDGENWEIVDTPSCSSTNATGNNFGCGYNRTTDGWLHENTDISKYAGKKVYFRFEYVTDAGVTGQGFVMDKISIPEIGYSTSFEEDNGGWKLEGFTRIENQIPQTFLVSVVRGSGSSAKIEKYSIVSGEPLDLSFNAGEDVLLVISGADRYTRQKVNYTIDID
jgi:hypothetical protein